MTLNGRVFEVRAERHLGVALAGLAAAAGSSVGVLRGPMLDFVEAHLGWAGASLAVSRLYRRTNGYAATRVGVSRDRSKRVPSGL